MVIYTLCSYTVDDSYQLLDLKVVSMLGDKRMAIDMATHLAEKHLPHVELSQEEQERKATLERELILVSEDIEDLHRSRELDINQQLSAEAYIKEILKSLEEIESSRVRETITISTKGQEGHFPSSSLFSAYYHPYYYCVFDCNLA